MILAVGVDHLDAILGISRTWRSGAHPNPGLGWWQRSALAADT
jgi:hypothetical protein